MWPFRHKKRDLKNRPSGPACSNCGSTNTRVITHHGTDHPDYVRVWKGQRFLTCRCFACGKDFYARESVSENTDGIIPEDQLIDDEEALHEAEDEIKRQVREDDDRRCY